MQNGARTLVLYDGNCRICAASARALRLIDIHRHLRVQTIQESRALLRGLPEDTLLDAAHAVSPGGQVTTGAEALPSIAGAVLGVPQIEPWLRSSRTAMGCLSGLYGIFVDVRERLTCGVAAPSAAGRIPR